MENKRGVGKKPPIIDNGIQGKQPQRKSGVANRS